MVHVEFMMFFNQFSLNFFQIKTIILLNLNSNNLAYFLYLNSKIHLYYLGSNHNQIKVIIIIYFIIFLKFHSFVENNFNFKYLHFFLILFITFIGDLTIIIIIIVI